MNKFLIGLCLVFSACSSMPVPIVTQPSNTETILQTGSFYPVVHAGSGVVKIVQKTGGKRFLRLENFSTDNGPAIYVWLSTAVEPKNSASVSIKPSDYLQLGSAIPAGTTYPIVSSELEIPAGVDISSFKSVVIWCIQFKVNFASAVLKIP